MATEYEMIGANATVEVVGGGATRNVRQITARAQPSGVVFTIVVDAADYTPARLRLVLPTIAQALNEAADVDGVVDISVYQDVNAAGQFVNKVTATVESESGNSSEEIHPAYGMIFDTRFADAVAKARANMDAIEAL